MFTRHNNLKVQKIFKYSRSTAITEYLNTKITIRLTPMSDHNKYSVLWL